MKKRDTGRIWRAWGEKDFSREDCGGKESGSTVTIAGRLMVANVDIKPCEEIRKISGTLCVKSRYTASQFSAGVKRRAIYRVKSVSNGQKKR
ncbi:MAG: hypothetical protein ACLTJ5_12065 [Clostridium sp.]